MLFGLAGCSYFDYQTQDSSGHSILVSTNTAKSTTTGVHYSSTAKTTTKSSLAPTKPTLPKPGRAKVYYPESPYPANVSNTQKSAGINNAGNARTLTGKPAYAKAAKPVQPIYVTHHYQTMPFDSVEVSGYANVQLINGYRSVSVKQLNTWQPASLTVQNRVLIIKAQNKNLNNTYTISVSAPIFRNLKAANDVFIQGSDIVAKTLTIEAADAASITLRGVINLRSIEQSGSGKIDVSWINTKQVNVSANGNGYIYLAGAAKSLSLKLKGSTLLDSRYLRAEEVNALTSDKAVAHIFASKKMDAYADTNSTIYYHNNLFKNMAIYSKDEGNVLQADVLQ